MEMKQIEYERNNAERAKDEKKKKKSIFRNRFKVKKEHAQEIAMKMSRKDKKEM
jgi:hypothetical protein